jgi:hypothetical protein
VNTPIEHARIAHDGLAARFVAGTLAGEMLERFEEHLLLCTDCQAEVALGLKIRAAGRDAVTSSVGAKRRIAFRRWAWPAIGVAAAAALAIWVPATGDRAAMRALGGVSAAPVYLGVAVRTSDLATNGFDSAFDDAMASYLRGAWDEAFVALRAVAERPDAGDGAAPARFFAASAALMSGDSENAEVEFARLLASPESAYHDDARFFRAKALLRLGRASDAISALRAVRDPALEPRARALSDSVEGLRSR